MRERCTGGRSPGLARIAGTVIFGGLMAAVEAAPLQALPTAHVPLQALPTAHVPPAVSNHRATLVGRPPAARRMELAISLPLRDQAGLTALLGALYDPASPQYRHYLSVAQFAARFAPSPAAYAAVEAFAAANGFTLREANADRLVVDVAGTVDAVERAFHVRLGVYRRPGAAGLFLAPDREPLIGLSTPVLHVSGLDDFTPPQSRLFRNGAGGIEHRATGSGPNGNFLGSDVRAAYYGGSALRGRGESVALLEFGGYNPGDVLKYFAAVHQPLTVPLRNVGLNGVSPILTCTAIGGGCDDSEQALDIEEAASMAPGLAAVTVYAGANAVSILARMASDNSSRQISSSWGWSPNLKVDEPLFEEYAAQGQSFVDATGDYGFHLREGVVWPADDPYVTGVGGTDLVTAGPGGAWAAETGWRFSGGGPSPTGIPIPAYQIPFVTPANGGSTVFRNAPDIAGDANTDNFSCYDGGCFTGNGGTSYAAPLWAGFIALANEAAATRGLPPVGFLNPLVYTLGGGNRYATAFHDQTQGFNGKYAAVPNYDLVTGFGSPTGQLTIEALIAGGR